MTKNNHDPLEVAVEQALWHVEQMCGPLSTETSIIEGDDDRSVLAHNLRAIIAQHYAPVIAENERLRQLASHASQAFDTYVQQVNDRDPSEAEAAYSSAFAALRNELDKALGAKP